MGTSALSFLTPYPQGISFLTEVKVYVWDLRQRMPFCELCISGTGFLVFFSWESFSWTISFSCVALCWIGSIVASCLAWLISNRPSCILHGFISFHFYLFQYKEQRWYGRNYGHVMGSPTGLSLSKKRHSLICLLYFGTSKNATEYISLSCILFGSSSIVEIIFP